MFFILSISKAVLIVFLVVSCVFFVAEILPGDPALIIAGEGASELQIQKIRQELELDKPLIQRYIKMLKSVFTLNFGKSIHTGQDIGDILSERIKNTAGLAVLSLIFSTAWGTLLFFMYMKFERYEGVLVALSTLLYSIPNFWLGVIFILTFGVKLKIFPISDYETKMSLVLPALTLSISLGVVLSRFMKNSSSEIMNSDFIKFVKAKGVSGIRFYLHLVKAILPGLLTVLGIQAGVLLSGVVVVEKVFSFPGIGSLAVDSALARDFPSIMACVFVISSVWVGVNFFVDTLIKLIDPRLR